MPSNDFIIKWNWNDFTIKMYIEWLYDGNIPEMILLLKYILYFEGITSGFYHYIRFIPKIS